MSESKGMDNIESFFKKSFGEFEDLPSKDLWKDISSHIPAYEVPSIPGSDTVTSEIAKGSVKVGSNAIKTITTILAKKAVIISGAVIMGTTGTYVAYETISKEEQPETETKSQISVPDSVNASAQEPQPIISESNGDTPENAGEHVSKDPENIDAIQHKDAGVPVVNDAPVADTSSVFEQPAIDHVAKKDSVLTVKEPEEKKPVKKETFYEKNTKKMKDTSRNVFSPE